MGASLLPLLLILLRLLLPPLVLLLLPLHSLTTAAGSAAMSPAANGSNLLHLSAGLNLSFSPASFNDAGVPISLNLMFSVATPTLDAGGLFFPILSSPSFSNVSATSFGYSLGFYLKPNTLLSDPVYPCGTEHGCNLYMAVCAGYSGNASIHNSSRVSLTGALSDQTEVDGPYETVDGFATPVWIANLNSPIRYVDRASLMVKELVTNSNPNSTGTLELHLLDGKNSVWRVPPRDADTMEMQDSGHLLIYNIANRLQPVWQSSPTTDTLVQGQRLTVGKELVSNDTSYVARLEKGGLVFYMNNIHFNREPRPPYWVFPLNYGEYGQHYKSLNQLISSAPNYSNSRTQVVADDIIVDVEFDEYLDLHPASCSMRSADCSSFIVITSSAADSAGPSLYFWRLESDGMLYSYDVVRSTSAAVTKSSTKAVAIPSLNVSVDLSRQECSVPMACGPLGLCTPGAQPDFCSCWWDPPGFEAVNTADLSQGCKRITALPNCSATNISGGGHDAGSTGRSTSFVQLPSTATIFLFTGWTFNSTPGLHDVNACKQSCSSECACNGFFYEVHTSSCFFMTDEITLLRVADHNYTPIYNQTNESTIQQSTLLARNYITFLKVVEEPDTPGKSSAGLIRLAVVISCISVVCLVLAAIVGYLFRARRKKFSVQTSNIMLVMQDSKELKDILPLLPNRFSYKELFDATQGFSTLLGAGGCGSVYAGLLSDGRKVAVKALQVVLQGTEQSKQFLAEIATIGRTNHHNIVRLVGFCWEVSQRLLVYEYVERGSLDHWIFVKSVACGKDDSQVEEEAPFLDWETRYNVALGIARGLNYLHEDCEKPILHFDIKPQNILLDNDFVAKLADFGMSKLIEKDMSAVVTRMRGTPGYIAPEWSSHGSVSKKSDVYSMGMVLLEIVGGRKNLDFSLLKSSSDPTIDEDAWHFPTWAAKKCDQGLIMEVIDHRLCGLVDVAQALNLIHIAFWCIQENPTIRPYATTVVQWLESKSIVEQPPFSVALNGRKLPTKLVSTFFSNIHDM